MADTKRDVLTSNFRHRQNSFFNHAILQLEFCTMMRVWNKSVVCVDSEWRDATLEEFAQFQMEYPGALPTTLLVDCEVAKVRWAPTIFTKKVVVEVYITLDDDDDDENPEKVWNRLDFRNVYPELFTKHSFKPFIDKQRKN